MNGTAVLYLATSGLTEVSALSDGLFCIGEVHGAQRDTMELIELGIRQRRWNWIRYEHVNLIIRTLKVGQALCGSLKLQ